MSRREPPDHKIRTTGPGPLVGLGVTGLVLGWLVRPVSIRIGDVAPTVGWLPVLALLFVAAVMWAVAWSTYRTIQRRRGTIEAYQAVNRLVLAKSCALAGALLAGGYFGYALSWWGLADAALARDRMVKSLVAAAAGVLIVAGSLALERACRIRGGEPGDLP